ncbi:MAG: DUF362 domain-containing protein [Phycisphaerae bacterium]|nr:DUF362 domain-containing protein [Phycisphaerae bacterium]
MQTNETAPCDGCQCASRRRKHRWARWAFPITGLAALVWFLVRVVPKPSRATYPCQRVAMPLASGFVIWIAALVTSVSVSGRIRRLVRGSRVALVGICLVTAAILGVASLADFPGRFSATGEPWGPHEPIGQAKGIHPGRVVWVHDPDATDWDGYDSPERWWQDGCTDPVVVERMVSQAIRGVAGRASDAAAWDAIFRHFNNSRGKGDVSYHPGEKIAVKINLTTCNAAGGDVNPYTYDKKSSVMNRIDNSPQISLSLLRQLVHIVGVDQSDITIGDPTGMVPNHYWEMVHPEFPDVHYLDNYGGSGRTRAEFSDVPLYWSTPEANGKVQDYLPTAFAEADYIVNFAILKGHSSGITLCAKNHYGSLIRTPDRYRRPELPGLPGQGMRYDYYNMHYSLPNAGQSPPWSPGTGRHRALVDLMGHSELGGKTVLHLIDGLFGGYYWEAHPYKWNLPPFNGDWPSSIFASQDPVAIDSVGYDFVNAEWPDVVRYGRSPSPKYDMQGGAEDYLHEAALANDPCSGTFYDPDHAGDVARLESLGVHEHWDNEIDKQYSRNLGTSEGIELVLLHSTAIEGDFDSDGDVDRRDLSALCENWLQRMDLNDSEADLNGDGSVDLRDLAILGRGWKTVTTQQSPDGSRDTQRRM